VAQRRVVEQGVGLVFELALLQVADPGEFVPYDVRRVSRRVPDRLDLRAVAGRQDHRLLDPRGAQARQRARQRSLVDEKPVAQQRGTGPVVGPDDENPA
jgi:hypothetical protein